MRKISRESIGQFAEITDDFSPVHLDLEYARSLGLKDNFAHGLLGATWAVGVLSRVAEVASAPVAAQFSFGIPVFCGDSISVESTPGAPTGQVDFSIVNEQGQQSTDGAVHFSDSFPASTVVPLAPDKFIPNENKVYFGRDMYEDGPRGVCSSFQFSEEDIRAYLEFSDESSEPYLDSGRGAYRCVPPMLVFCRAFSGWLKAFTAVQTPDGGFPGHLQDKWQQHAPVLVGEKLTVRHQVTAFRESKSKPGMALITIELQVFKHSEELAQSGSVLLMMAA
jgi:acyl dehydratase